MLTELLGEKGWCSYDDVKRLSDEQGVSMGTLKNAKKALNLKTIRVGFGKGSINYWITADSDSENMKHVIEEYILNHTDNHS
ncbi:MAG: hypothetical protein K6B74_06030 [Ruminococcus sp.]|nr:hypothetical protein [Ruminococcus sp.]